MPADGASHAGTGPRAGLPLVLACATGLAVAGNYYAQPLLPAIAADLSLSSTAAGLVITCGQVGYAAGLVFLLPLGDVLERRRLLVVLAGCTAVALAGLALAAGPGTLLGAAAALGVVSVQAQILVPLAAHLASDDRRGRAVGTVMSGLLLGILLARTAAGAVAGLGGWRAIYLVSAAVMVVQAVVFARVLPRLAPPARTSHYSALLASTARLLRTEPVLRLRCLYGLLSFAAFTVLWTSIAFLLAGPSYGYSAPVIGLFGLVGAAGAASARFAGRVADRGRTRATTTVASLVLALSWLPLWLGGTHLWALVVGLLTFDAAAQALHITNQSRVYELAADARTRLTSVYMTSYFLGGAVGATVSAVAWHAGGWAGVAAAGAGFGAVGLVVALADGARTADGHRT